MSSPYGAVNQRPYHQQALSPSSSGRRQSKITVEYHRPSRESIQEYNDLLNDSNRAAAAAASAANYKDPFLPSRQAPPPPPVSTSSVKAKALIDSAPSPTSPAHRVRNSLHKPPPRGRKGSLPNTPTSARVDKDPFAASNGPGHSQNTSISQSNSNEMVSPPPRPSRANTATLNDMFPTEPSTLPTRRLSNPIAASPSDAAFFADVNESMPAIPITEYNNLPVSNSGTRARSSTKSKKGMLGFMSEFLTASKRPEISTPYDPVHLTHVGFNSSTGEFTGLPKEWQQLLQESGISRQEQEKNPLAVMEIVKFYQEGHGDVWDKMGALDSAPEDSVNLLQNPVSISEIRSLLYSTFTLVILACRTSTSHKNLTACLENANVPSFSRTHVLPSSPYTSSCPNTRHRSLCFPAQPAESTTIFRIPRSIKHLTN
jgi:p21-activated kinase 1